MTRSRRVFVGHALLSLVAGALSGCVSRAERLERELVPPTRPDRQVARLDALVTTVGLDWLVTLRPAELGGIAWLRPSLSRIFRDDRLDALARSTGIDLRDATEVVLAGHRAGAATAKSSEDSSVLYLVRHTGEPLVLERKFRERLTGDAERRELGHQLIGVWGRIGRQPHGFVAAGRHVVAYQYGGSIARGSARIAALLADGKLSSVPRASEDPDLAALDAQLRPSAARATWLGPFEGHSARALGGLVGSATSVGVGLEPVAPAILRLVVRLRGHYRDGDAVGRLLASFDELAKTDLGHLLGLGALREPASSTVDDDGLTLRAGLDANALLEGLAAATLDEVRDIMR